MSRFLLFVCLAGLVAAIGCAITLQTPIGDVDGEDRVGLTFVQPIQGLNVLSVQAIIDFSAMTVPYVLSGPHDRTVSALQG